jgi:hypothetical protein
VPQTATVSPPTAASPRDQDAAERVPGMADVAAVAAVAASAVRRRPGVHRRRRFRWTREGDIKPDWR